MLITYEPGPESLTRPDDIAQKQRMLAGAIAKKVQRLFDLISLQMVFKMLGKEVWHCKLILAYVSLTLS